LGVQRAGDATNSNIVNTQDFSILRQSFGKSMGDPGYDARADFDNNRVVNLLDFNLVKTNFGQAGAEPTCH
jgi:hypothetical protein